MSSGRAPTLAENATSITLGRAAPHAGFLSFPERVLEARLLHATLGAHQLGDLGVLFPVGIEDARIEPPTRAQHPPLKFVC